MNDTVYDCDHAPIAIGDCVERNDVKYAVMGLSECCGDDIVILGEMVGGKLARPYCEIASWMRKV